MDKQKILAHPQTIQDGLEDKPDPVFKPEIGDWLEFSDYNDFSGRFLAKYDRYEIRYHTQDGRSAEFSRRPIGHTDILIKVDGSVMPEWIRGKDVSMFFHDGTSTRNNYPQLMMWNESQTKIIKSFLVHSG